MKKGTLHVFAGADRAGRLFRSEREDDTFLFTYRERCPPASAVSLTMPVVADPYDAMGGLLPIFEMNLPEGRLKEALRDMFAKTIVEFDDLDMLAIVGSSQIGRLRTSSSTALDGEVPEQSVDEILTYAGSADLFEHLLGRFAKHSGVSGMQPKVLVREHGSVDRVTHRAATHIVKAFDASKFPELGLNELLCTEGALVAGIPTARLRLSQNRRLLVVDRFDLTADGTYLGIEDFCVLDGRRAHGRYDGSYEGIARRIVDFVSPEELPRARTQLAKMVVYACTIENGDAHLKNFAVLYSEPEGTVSLAPAYDLVSTTPYLPRDTLALTLGASKTFPARRELLRFVREVTGKNEGAARELIDEVLGGVEATRSAAQRYARRGSKARPIAEAIVAATVRGLARARGSA